MELKPQELVKINDFKAHLHSLQVELSVVLGELDIALANKRDAEEKVLKIEERIASAHTTLDAIESKGRDIEASSASREKNCALKEAEIDSKIKEFEAYKDKQNSLIDTRKAEYEAAILEKRDIIAALDIKKLTLESQIPGLEERVSSLLSDVRKLENERHDATDAISKASLAHEEEVIRIKKELVAAENELKSVLEKINTEKGKISLPMKALSDRDEQVSKRERNFEIMKARMKKHFEQMYPGQTLKI